MSYFGDVNAHWNGYAFEVHLNDRGECFVVGKFDDEELFRQQMHTLSWEEIKECEAAATQALGAWEDSVFWYLSAALRSLGEWHQCYLEQQRDTSLPNQVVQEGAIPTQRLLPSAQRSQSRRGSGGRRGRGSWNERN